MSALYGPMVTSASIFGATSALPVWWTDKGRYGLRGYVGASDEGIEFRRHDALFCKPGLWSVAVTGWSMRCNAVVDDFGQLVGVPA